VGIKDDATAKSLNKFLVFYMTAAATSLTTFSLKKSKNAPLFF